MSLRRIVPDNSVMTSLCTAVLPPPTVGMSHVQFTAMQNCGYPMSIRMDWSPKLYSFTGRFMCCQSSDSKTANIYSLLDDLRRAIHYR